MRLKELQRFQMLLFDLQRKPGYLLHLLHLPIYYLFSLIRRLMAIQRRGGHQWYALCYS